MLLARRIRYGMVTITLLIVAWLVWQSRGALIPFAIGGILAYLLTPLVDRLARVFPFHRSRNELARTLAILIIYLAGAGILVSAGALIAPVIVGETGDLIDNIPNYADRVQERAQEWTDRYREQVPEDVQRRVDEYVQRLGASAGSFGQQLLNRTLSMAQNMFSVVLGYVVIPFWLFYILKDRHKIGPTIQNWFPPGLRQDVDNCIRICQRVLGSYIRAQLTLGFFIGIVTTIGLYLLDVPGWAVLGIIAGITELIPVLGPIIGAVPALIVVIATEPERAWIVLLFYIAVQQVENAVLVPRIQGSAVNMHPALIIVLLVIAQQVAGFIGMIVAVPLAAVGRDLFIYIYRRLQEREQEDRKPRVLRLNRPPPTPARDEPPRRQEPPRDAKVSQ